MKGEGGEESEMLVGHASRHASFAGNRDRPLERSAVRGPSSSTCLRRPSIFLDMSPSLLLPPQVSPLVSWFAGPVCAESSWPQVISQVFEVGFKLSRGPQKKAFCRSALAVRSNDFFSLFLPPLPSLSLSLFLAWYSVNRLGETRGWNDRG